MKGYIEIIDVINSYKILGNERLSDGTYLVARATHIAPKAWLHAIYPPLMEAEINNLEDEIGINIPSEFKEFLKLSNGFSFFSGALEIFGKRSNYKRDTDSVWQPFDIVKRNTVERIADAHTEDFFFGSYKWDGSILYISKEGNVNRCSRQSAKALNTWESFDSFLSFEANRLQTIFDEKGIKNDSNIPTCP